MRSHIASSISLMYSWIEKSLPHAVQRKVTVRQPKWSSTGLLQTLHFIYKSLPKSR